MWYNLTLAMVGETTSGSCPAPAMFLGQSEASNAIDISIHLWWGTTLGVGAAAVTTRRNVLMMCLDDVPGATIHDVELLAVLVVTGLKVGVAVYDLDHPLGILELHLLLLISLVATCNFTSRWR
jgi:hypothetical protein